MSHALLQASGVHNAFGSRSVLDAVDLVLPPWQLLLVVGPNGSGKTTLVRILSGVLTPGEARNAVDLEVILVIAGAFGLAAALQVSGLAALVAQIVVETFGGWGPRGGARRWTSPKRCCRPCGRRSEWRRPPEGSALGSAAGTPRRAGRIQG